MRKWWLLQHIADPSQSWIPARLITICGVPICSFFFRAWGPWPTKQAAIDATTHQANTAAQSSIEGSAVE